MILILPHVIYLQMIFLRIISSTYRLT